MIKHLIFIEISEYNGSEKGLASMVYQFFDEKLSSGAVTCIRYKRL